ncbi:MAG TPA: 3-oxoacid CoA-transferase subunit B [Thermotogota bacterium]|nr:3-oxoacid CoA-transferase subunit B [Thermotogota bacterium]HRW91717.1 3-oxoacid CoA-transferase subunit B [Thermotogota bacterium]
MDAKKAREWIAQRVAKELHDGDVVNLGIGIPTLVANFLPQGVQIFLQSENGVLGMGPVPPEGFENPEISNAGGMPVSFLPGAAAFDSATSFGLIRGGHVDVTVLGALQVDARGHLANWMIPGKLIPGMGGAMDLVTGAKKVIVAMTHTNKDGSPKIIETCTLPLTSIRKVDLVVTDAAVLEVNSHGLVLQELGPQTTLEELIQSTGANLIIPEKFRK